MRIFFFNKYIGKVFGDLQQFEKTDELCHLEVLKKIGYVMNA